MRKIQWKTDGYGNGFVNRLRKTNRKINKKGILPDLEQPWLMLFSYPQTINKYFENQDVMASSALSSK